MGVFQYVSGTRTTSETAKVWWKYCQADGLGATSRDGAWHVAKNGRKFCQASFSRVRSALG